MPQRPLSLLACVVLVACAPILDWRVVRPSGSGIEVLFPCKPQPASRPMQIAGVQADMTVHACVAGGVTWGLGVVDVADPARVGPALRAMAAVLQSQAMAPAQAWPFQVPGMTPQTGTTRLAFGGKREGGSTVQVHVALFSKGTRVYQVSAIGERPSAEALDTYFGALRLSS